MDHPAPAETINPRAATPPDRRCTSQRPGVQVVGRRMFDMDDRLVHRLERATWKGRTQA